MKTAPKRSFWSRAADLYIDGFRTMSKTSRKLWLIILIKLFVMFAVLRLFFFPDIIGSQGSKEQQRQFVVEQFTHPKDAPQALP